MPELQKPLWLPRMGSRGVGYGIPEQGSAHRPPGRDVDLRYTQAGNAVANISLATDESYTDKEGNKVDRTEWHRVVAYGKTAELCERYLAKGSLAYIEGSLQTRKWQDQSGQDRYTTEIKAQNVRFLSRKGEAQGDNAPATDSPPPRQWPSASAPARRKPCRARTVPGAANASAI